MAGLVFLETIRRLIEVDIDILQISRDFYMVPTKKGNVWFVKSPVSVDKTWSLLLNPDTNSFVDFAAGNLGGDAIRFVSYVKGCTNWDSLKALRSFYGLDIPEKGNKDIRRRISLEQREKKKKELRKKEFWTALRGCVERLKRMEFNYRKLFQETKAQGDCEAESWLIGELGTLAEKLNILCGVPSRYFRLKENSAKGLPSDRPAWLLDSMRILRNEGFFEPTKEELKEIQSVADLGNLQRPGWNGRCVVG
ncbi:MAG: hypothetical protein HFG66_00900 [Hungatella sp.]|nr:hypothetical protein [Hungatella sp.]